MIYLSYCAIGVFSFNERKEVKDFSLFPRDSKEALKKIEKLKKGEIVEELEEILKKTKEKNIVTNIEFDKEGYEIEFRDKISVFEYLKNNMRDIALKTNFARDSSEINKFISEMQIEKTRKRIKKGNKKDKIAMQAASCIEDLVDISNRMSERLHEWYGFYYPELEEKVKDNKKYAEIISETPRREMIEGFEDTIGIDLDEKDIEAFKNLAEKITEIFELNEKIEKYLEKLMPEIAPNTSAVAGPVLAAKLTVIAGGMKNLSKLPSSTIQLLGAEKALFRFIKSKKKSRPPKYGIIFLHPDVTNSPPELRGKVARAVASEISMAIKTDFYTNENRSEEYKKKLKERIKEIFNKK